jgi:Flp pilus assembly protein CpaB
MVMTRADDDAAPTVSPRAAPARVVSRAPGVPSARAVVGGLLVAAAGVGTFVSWQATATAPDDAYAVAVRSLQPGERLADDMVRFEPIDLPDGVARAAFDAPGELEGRVVVAPVGEGELIQSGSLSDQLGGGPVAEVSVTLARALAVDGRLRPGDTVDVYATDEDTTVAARDVRVVAVTEAGGTFADGRELTVTLALGERSAGTPIVHAARAGQVTLVRTTHAVDAPDRADGAGTAAG